MQRYNRPRVRKVLAQLERKSKQKRESVISDEPQTALILTSDSGFGHRSAANSIAKALMLLHPQEAEVAIVNPIFEQPTNRFLKKTELNYDKMVSNYPSWYRLTYEISDSRSASTIVEGTGTRPGKKNPADY